jgi:hypothetical protein
MPEASSARKADGPRSTLADSLGFRNRNDNQSRPSRLCNGVLMEKGDFLVTVKQKITSITIEEFSQDGVKIRYNAMGKVTGKYSGRHLETIDILRRQDGSNQWESRVIQTTTDGDVIMILAKGIGKQDTLTTVRFQGEGTIMTQSKQFSELNSTRCWIEGTNDLENDEAVFTICAMN